MGQWAAPKKEWCCRVHNICGQPTAPPPPPDPYNCADGFANWQAGWSAPKKVWCCAHHGKGCPGQGNGCAPIGTTSPPFDCNAGFATLPPAPTPPADPFNCAVDQYFQWAAPKKEWCCRVHNICGQPTQPPPPPDPYNCADG